MCSPPTFTKSTAYPNLDLYQEVACVDQLVRSGAGQRSMRIAPLCPSRALLAALVARRGTCSNLRVGPQLLEALNAAAFIASNVPDKARAAAT